MFELQRSQIWKVMSFIIRSFERWQLGKDRILNALPLRTSTDYGSNKILKKKNHQNLFLSNTVIREGKNNKVISPDMHDQIKNVNLEFLHDRGVDLRPGK